MIRKLCGFFTLISSLLLAAPGLGLETLLSIRWLGRVNVVTHSFALPGSGFEVRFKGTTVLATLTASGADSVIAEIDGLPRRINLSRGSRTYELTSKLPSGEHVLRVTKRTQGFVGKISLRGISTDGEFTPPIQPTKRILAIGDSILTGYGVEGKSKECSYSPDTENQYLTYPAIVARELGADVTTIAASSRGVTVNWKGDSKDTMPQIYQRLDPIDRYSDAPLEGGIYDIILFNLGTNDFGNGKRPGTFEEDYRDFIHKIEKNYPDAKIYLAFGPMLSKPDYLAAKQAIMNVAAALNSPSVSRVKTIFFERNNRDEMLGCNWHPNALSHQMMAKQFLRALRQSDKW